MHLDNRNREMTSNNRHPPTAQGRPKTHTKYMFGEKTCWMELNFTRDHYLVPVVVYQSSVAKRPGCTL